MSVKRGGKDSLSAGSQCPSLNGFEECLAGLLEPVRRLVVADPVSGGVECFKTDAGVQMLFGIGERFELVIGRHHGLVAIDLALFALAVRAGLGEETGAVEVEVGIAILLVEVVG